LLPTPTEHAPADKRGSQEGVGSSEQACMRLDERVEEVYAYLCTMDAYWMKCGIMASLWVGMYCIEPNCNRMSVESHIVNGIVISWLIACCLLLLAADKIGDWTRLEIEVLNKSSWRIVGARPIAAPRIGGRDNETGKMSV